MRRCAGAGCGCDVRCADCGGAQDLDLYDDKRTLVYSGPLGRRWNEKMSQLEVPTYRWIDLHVALLDSYRKPACGLAAHSADQSSHRSAPAEAGEPPRRRPQTLGRVPRKSPTSPLPLSLLNNQCGRQPIPLEYLRLGSFSDPPEKRKEQAEDGSRFHFRSTYRDVWPFTIYHAYEKSRRRYTLFAGSEAVRGKWRNALMDALAVREAQQESNMVREPVWGCGERGLTGTVWCSGLRRIQSTRGSSGTRSHSRLPLGT